MQTQKAYTPAELRELANERGPMHPHWDDAARGALRYCADVIEAANAALEECRRASPQKGKHETLNPAQHENLAGEKP